MMLYFILLAPAMLLAMWAAAATRMRFAHYSKVMNEKGISGAEVARTILDRQGLTDVQVVPVPGQLSDHYDPGEKVVRLSPEVFQGRSISALAVSAHEVGHAIQDGERYSPLALRSASVPLARFGSSFSFILIFAGMAIGALGLAKLGVALFLGVIFFQLVTLPVEFNASTRAKRILFESGFVTAEERAGVSKVLNAAAMTYVAAALTSVLTLVYYLIQLGLIGGRND